MEATTFAAVGDAPSAVRTYVEASALSVLSIRAGLRRPRRRDFL